MPPRKSRIVRTRQSLQRRRARTDPDERSARIVVTRRSGGVCEGCGQARATDWSHRIGQGVGGPWSPSNGLHLCRPCHSWLHHQPAAARDERGWRLLSTDDPLTCPALLAVHGWVLLDDEGFLLPAEGLIT